MATDVETLVARMELDFAKFQQDMAGLTHQIDQDMGKIQRSIDDALGGFADKFAQQTQGAVMSFDSVIAASAIGLQKFAGILAAAFSFDALYDSAKQYDKAKLSLDLMSKGADAASRDLERLTKMAMEQGQPIDALTKFYQKLANSQSLLKISGSDILTFEDGIINAFRASGLSASQASGQMDGLVNVMRSGKVEMGTFNSLLDTAPPVLKAVAAGMQEAGGSVDKLRTLIDDGKVSGEAFFRAFMAGQPTIEGLRPATDEFGESLQGVKVAFGEFAASLESDLGLVHTFAEGLRVAAGLIHEIKLGIPQVVDAGRFGGMAEMADQNRLDDAAFTGAKPSPSPSYVGAIPRPRPLSPIKASDYPVKDKGGKGGSDDEEGAFDKANKALEKRIEDLALEQEMLGKSNMEREKAKASLDLMRTAEEEELPITPELTKKIEAQAEAFAIQADAVKTAKDEMAQMKELQTFIGTSMSSFFSDIMSGGRNAEQAIMHLTKRLTDMALQAVLLGSGPFAGLFGTKGADGAVGGLIGAMFGGFKFADGGVMGGHGPMALNRYAAGGVASMPQLAMFGEGSSPEAYVPLPDGRNIPVALRLPQIQSQAATAAGAMTVYNIDARGADQVAIAKLQAQIVAMQRGAGATVDNRVQVNRVRGTRS